MGQQQSKDKLLYQQVSDGNIDEIKSLRAAGASLEWTDKEGKTPLSVACMNPELYNVAKTLIDLGADINAYPLGYYAATPMHHAAERGLDQTVQLLLSHGASAVLIHGGQTPLQLARSKGHTKVVRTIEAHICLFSGWLTELGIAILMLRKPFDSRKVWVVVLPSDHISYLEIALYKNKRYAQPQTTVTIRMDGMQNLHFNQNEPVFIRTTLKFIKLTSLSENGEQKMRSFCYACKGIPQQAPVVHASAPRYSEQVELDMAIEASLQSFTQQSPDSGFGADASSSTINPVHGSTELPIPSAPFDVDDIYTTPPVERSDTKPDEVKDVGTSSSSSCAICLEAPLEGACIPCGHMAGCMACMTEIKENEWGCPICRRNIDSVLRIYPV